MVRVDVYLWQGSWGPFTITSHCAECDLATGLLSRMQEEEFQDSEVEVRVRPWLDNWLYCLLRGAWHPPIVFVDGKKFFQHSKKQPIFVREELAAYVRKQLRE